MVCRWPGELSSWGGTPLSSLCSPLLLGARLLRRANLGCRSPRDDVIDAVVVALRRTGDVAHTRDRPLSPAVGHGHRAWPGSLLSHHPERRAPRTSPELPVRPTRNCGYKRRRYSSSAPGIALARGSRRPGKRPFEPARNPLATWQMGDESLVTGREVCAEVGRESLPLPLSPQGGKMPAPAVSHPPGGSACLRGEAHDLLVPRRAA
jgi:hypothetical protein